MNIHDDDLDVIGVVVFFVGAAVLVCKALGVI